ncbi:Maintenance of ploidy protein mob1 [Zancudomyces culisetae]|uniref:Maintenance of ploidy protein mob1 n=1 Tax=Zancudomyces culisetae TaxID=1213189 RepID=A0A1R1PF08_ZANCU|nr:Maintenance of ploidy protein mob1 [Zancudomyces culisetae]|eukprot:OMH79498.1 Maintenance of ploidy protein mob1 [Zancudomyces culisetae]
MDKEGGEQAMLLDNDQWNMFERNHRGYDRGPATGSLKFQLRQFAEDTLGEDSLKLAVNLPEGEDKSEWIACHSNTGFLQPYQHTVLVNLTFMHRYHMPNNVSWSKVGSVLFSRQLKFITNIDGSTSCHYSIL